MALDADERFQTSPDEGTFSTDSALSERLFGVIGALIAKGSFFPETPSVGDAPVSASDSERTLFAAATTGQWHLDSATGYDINVLPVWQDYTGAGVTVGVVDSGIQYTHHELSGNYNASIDYDFLQGNDDGANKVSGDNHGTAVAGVIAAANNGTGSTGVAYDAEITSFRLISNVGISGTMLSNAFRQDVDISNNSWGWTKPFAAGSMTSTIESALQYGVSTNRGGLGTIYVFAAGNEGDVGENTNYSEMQNSRFTIEVAAANENGTLASFSTPGTTILVAAPGTRIYTTDLTGTSGYASGDYATVQGTSFAAPAVSGIVALMLEANPNLGYRDVQEILAYSAIKVNAGDSQWAFNGAENWNGGGLHVHEGYGYGFVDATAAVRLAETWNLIDGTADVYTNEESFSITSALLNRSFDNTTIFSTINVGTAIEIDHVELQLNLTHNWIPDLSITLTSPDGTQSLLFDRPPSSNQYGAIQTTYSSSWSFSSTHHWGELSTGQWIVSITDHAAGNAGLLQDFTLKFYGDSASNDDTYIYTNEYAGFTGTANASRRSLSDDTGNDTINASAVSSNSIINLNAGTTSTIAGNSLAIASGTSIENAVGGDGNDIITGNGLNNILYGERGTDNISAGTGNDTLYGGTGNDTLDGGNGVDVMYGGAGDDIYYVDNLLDEIVEFLNEGYDIVYSTVANYVLSAYVELLQMIGSGNINVTGTEYNDTLYGNTGNNIITGLAGDDRLYGDAGNDRLEGGDGQDTLEGGSGADEIMGGLGNDTYLFSNAWGADVLTDDGGLDTIDFSNVNNVALNINLNSTDAAEVAYGTNSIQWSSNAIEHVVGGNSNDTITGNGSDNNIQGGSGYDTLYGGAGNDTLDGGTYSDTLYGGLGNDSMLGSDGYDQLNGEDGNDTLIGGTGNDTVIGGAGSDYYVFGDNTGADTVNDTSGADTFDFSAATSNLNLNLSGSSGTVSLINGSVTWTGMIEHFLGGTGNDTVTGNTLNNSLNGGTGDDTYKFLNAFGQDTIIDGAGNDTVDLSGITNVAFTVQLVSGIGSEVTYGTNTINWDNNAIENIIAGSLNDSLTGNDANNILNGGAGNDRLEGGLGNDSLIGGSGSDSYVFFTPSWGNDTITDSSGADYINLSGTSAPLNIDLRLGSIADNNGNSITLNGTIESVNGGRGNDIFTGDSYSNTFYGGGGNDTYKFYNSWGQDTINEEMVGEPFQGTSDTVDLSSVINASITANLVSNGALAEVFYGTNTINWSYDAIENLIGGKYHDTITGSGANNLLDGHDGNDTVRGGLGDDTIYGGSGADSLYGEDGNDRLDGGTYSDLLDGGAGNDSLQGGDGWDTLLGDIGNDTLEGGSGNDTLNGGAGNDTYIFNNTSGNDTILDSDGIETLDFSQVTTGMNLNLSNTTARIYINATNSVGWENVLIEHAIAGSGNNTLTGNTANNLLQGGAGNDTYTGFAGNFGSDTISDSAGTGDTLNLSDYTSSQTTWSRLDSNNDGYQDTLFLNLGNGNSVSLFNYFANSGTVGYGAGLVETIQFSDESYNFSSVINKMGLSLSTINGTSGNDNLAGTANPENIYGFAGNDTLVGSEGNDYLDGGTGKDTIYGGDGDDIIIAGPDRTSAYLYTEEAMLYGGLGNDIFYGDNGYTSYNGEGGNDTYYFGSGGNDASFIGNWGNDYIVFSSVKSSINRLSFSSTGGMTFDFRTNMVSQGANSLTWEGDIALTDNLDVSTTSGNDTIYLVGNMNVWGGNGNDLFFGSEGSNWMQGLGGIDTLYGYAGNDRLWDNGDGFLYGGSGNDEYSIDPLGGIHTISDESGNDDYIDFWRNSTVLTNSDWKTADSDSNGYADQLIIGTWAKIENYFDNTAAMGTGTGLIERIIFDDISMTVAGVYAKLGITMPNESIEQAEYNVNSFNFIEMIQVNGSDEAEELVGDSADNMLNGYRGDDTLIGSSGNDTLRGQEGTDTFKYIGNENFGNDFINDISSSDNDTLDLSGFTLDLVLNWQALDSSDPDSYADQLFMDFGNGNSITIYQQFDNTASMGAGVSAIEKIIFKDTVLGFDDIQEIVG